MENVSVLILEKLSYNLKSISNPLPQYPNLLGKLKTFLSDCILALNYF